MSGCCSIRALWVINTQDAVVFSRRFPTVERRWRTACETENITSQGGYALKPLMPTDAELAAAFSNRKTREGSIRGSGIRVSQASQRSIDSWADDPITRHIIALSVDTEDGGEVLLWPLALHVKGYFYIAVLPFIEPHHLKAFVKMSNRSDCGNSVQGNESISSLLLGLPCITGSLMVAGVIGDVITGDLGDPEVVPSTSASVGGLLDSLTGSIGIGGISARAKPVANVSSTPSAAAATGPLSSEAPKSSTRPIDKDALRTFIANSMPFGTPLDLNFTNMNAIKLGGFSSSDPPPSDLRLPAWKPYLYKGKQRVLFTVQEVVSAALYDRDEIPDSTIVSGQVNCRAELEGLPDVTCHFAGSNVEALSFHPCAQVPERGGDGQSVMFTPPLGNFVLMRYQTSKGLNAPVKGFYQLSMVSEDEGAFLFKLRLMEGYKSPATMEFCTVTMPFPQRKVTSLEGNPSVGTAVMSDHGIEWKVVTSGRSITGRSVEAIFPGTVKFASLSTQRKPSSRLSHGNFLEDECEMELETSSSSTNVEEFLVEKMNRVLLSADLDEPLCWQAYNYARVSFTIYGGSGTVSGFSIDPKSVNIYPTSKSSTDLSVQLSSGDYILWNTLGKCPVAAVPDKQ